MEKVVRKIKSHAEQEAADRDFHRTLTPQERVDLMLRIIHEANRDAPPRMARVCRVVKLGKGDWRYRRWAAWRRVTRGPRSW